MENQETNTPETPSKEDVIKWMNDQIEFKKVQNDKIGELYLDEDTTFGFDYWKNGFEGCNSLGGWLTFKEIEFIIFPKIIDSNKNITQDLNEIEKLINEFEPKII